MCVVTRLRFGLGRVRRPSLGITKAIACRDMFVCFSLLTLCLFCGRFLSQHVGDSWVCIGEYGFLALWQGPAEPLLRSRERHLVMPGYDLLPYDCPM